MNSTKVFGTDGQRFGFGGSRACGATAATESVPALDDPTMTALSMLLSSLTGSESETCRGLIAARATLNAECAIFLQQRHEKALSEMEAAHEAIKAECEEQLDHIQALKNRLAELQQEMNQHTDDKGVALANLRGARSDLASLSRFASKSKIEKAEAAVKDAVAKVESLNPREAEIRQEWQRIELTELPKANERMRDLSIQEREARAAVTGEAFVDGLGIVHPGRQ
jgi:chromosome segregation ATPase